MANPIIKIKRSNAATGVLGTPSVPTLTAGEFAVDQINKDLYLGLEDASGVITPVVVGGEGTFATKTYVNTALSGVSGTLGTMATQNANAVNITGGTINNSANPLTISGADIFNGTIDGAAISTGTIDGTSIGATIASTGKFTSLDVTLGDITMSGSGLIDMNAGRITNLSAPVNANDSVRKTDLDSAISALGSVFHYEGPITSFFVPATAAATQPLDLDTLNQTTGAYYQIDYDYVGSGTNATVELTYAGLATPIKVKQGDAIVKTTTGWQKLDNVDVVVSGTTNEISVTGDDNAGYTVALDSAFKTRVSDVELKTVNITATAPATGPASGTTDIIGAFSAGAGSGGSIIKIPANAGVLEINEFGNQIGAKVHATLDLVDSNWGLGDSTNGFIALRAAGNLVGVDHTYGGLSQMSKIENFVIDGGSY